jgi:hypothetical protein
MTYEAHKTLEAADRARQDAQLLRDLGRIETADTAPLVLRPCPYCGDPAEAGSRLCHACNREEALG